MNLTITRLKKSDFDEYTCSAINRYGRSEGVIILKGKFKMYLNHYIYIKQSDV